jgi:anti-sigma factor RsiW
MNCSHELIEGYLDGELDLKLYAEVEQHLAECEACSDLLFRLRKQKDEIKSFAPYYAAPAQLRHSISTALRETQWRGATNPWRWLAIAASLLLVASLAANLIVLRSRTTNQQSIAQTLIASHIRSLMGTHLLDVVSTDQHTVKPWFNGKIDFSPAVKDFAPQGFPLIGGRLDYAAGRTVAALVYRRRQHVINLFVWPSTAADTKESRLARNGFNVIHWSDGSMTYWAISDVNPADLAKFKELWGSS